MRAWMKYWLMAVSSAHRTSCRTWMTSSLPFMAPPARGFARDLTPYAPEEAERGLPVDQGSARVHEGPEVRQAGRARAAAARPVRDLVEGEPFLAEATLDLRERERGALAARHAGAPGFGSDVGRSGGQRTHERYYNETEIQFQLRAAAGLAVESEACRRPSTSPAPVAT